MPGFEPYGPVLLILKSPYEQFGATFEAELVPEATVSRRWVRKLLCDNGIYVSQGEDVDRSSDDSGQDRSFSSQVARKERLGPLHIGAERSKACEEPGFPGQVMPRREGPGLRTPR